VKHLYEIRGRGRCAGTITHVLGTDENDAMNRLLRDDASPFYEIGSVAPFTVLVPANAIPQRSAKGE
jgi:hypothetical protein